jgi:hypothetical protein
MRIDKKAIHIAAVVCHLVFLSATTQAQTGDYATHETTPIANAVRTDVAPDVDGQLNEPLWNSAPVIVGFVQHEPLEGQPPTEHTEIRIVYDATAVYVGARMLDSDPRAIRFGENRRDAGLQNADALLLVLDTFHDRQNAYVFGTTAAGIEYDGQVTKDGQGGLSQGVRRIQAGAGAGGGFNLNWDGSWDVATFIDDEGWYAEFRIPFATLRYAGSGPQQWGLNISRTIRRSNEEVFWAPIGRQHTLYRVSEAGTLQGIEAPVRRSVRVTPYMLSSVQRDFELATEADWTGEFGADAKIGLTPGLNLDLTYNTDFAQVEADEQQVNLTRFSLFFPEKRPFFLENAGLFAVGIPRAGTDLGLDLFYSRRIGIGEGGQPIPIIGGGRLTGTVGGVSVGLLSLQTDEVNDAAIGMNNYAATGMNNYSVGRFLKELPNRSQIGAMVISRLNTDSTGDYNLTYSVDGRLGIGENINIDGHVARTETPGLNGREHAIGLTGAYLTRDWNITMQYREVGEDFNPEVGFVPRSNYRVIIGRVQRNIRVPSIGWIRELQPHIVAREWRGFDGFEQTRYIHIDNAIAMQNGGYLSTVVNIRREGLQRPFEIAEDIFVPAATYDFAEFLLRFNTDASAPLSLTSEATVGSFFSGDRRSATATITNRIGSTWTAALIVNYNDVDLPEGNFERTLVGLKAAYAFTPRVYLQALIQYDNQRDDIFANMRFGWLNTAGTGLFLVYNEVQRTVSPTGPRDRVFIVKYNRQISLTQ